MQVLAEALPNWRSLRIYEVGGTGPSTQKLAAECPEYVSSQFHSSVPPGTVRDGIRYEDLHGLSFPNETFDVVITQDVFEHVLRPDRAFSEIARVLVPGGAHVFSVPLFGHPETLVRAEPAPDGGVTHLLQPDYHKDPMDPAGSLVTREWSTDIVDFIHQCSGLTTTIHKIRDRRLGIDGDHREILVSSKPGSKLH